MTNLPENVKAISPDETFQFACHPDLACFTECCRELELALTPYDVLRLRKVLGITSQDFLGQHAVIEFNDEMPYPMIYLGMVDNGKAQCPFVDENGCRVYKHRPGACRTYPLGRGASLEAKGNNAIHVLIREPHCQGFAENKKQCLEDWQADQEIKLYNKFNDEMLAILNHPAFLNGGKMTQDQADSFILSLYNCDGQLPFQKIGEMSDEELLSYAINWFIDNKL
jgi:Fe-S-cluster containining protein